ncbi:hypothetical protein E4T44_06891 [Aureobasidium sp. EXF-8845]|nr:hypothetical protein E4T44_06891 [Aureobasidium sp. EXF-8845]KAI4847220.1 hypothetical protein E4T45_06877 [Aureobasidium sp. EXF-8846]
MAFQPDQTKYKLCYFVPPSSLQSTKDAIFATHLAGIFSSLTDANKTLYTDVCWETSGTGRFIPGLDSTPDIGTPGQLEVLEEVRVEVQVQGRESVKKVVDVLKE